MREPLRFEGVMPANLLPFRADLSIDEPAYRGHLRWLADVRGVTGLVVNGHAAEVSSLDREERRRAVAIAVDEVREALPVVAGVYTDGTREAVRLALDAKAEGAAGILLFPPTPFMWGAQQKPDMAVRHVSEVAAGADLPIVVFEYPPASGIGYSPETLARLCEISQVAAVKDWSNDIVAFERNLRAIRATGRPVAVLSSFTMSLMASFLLGADGVISGMGSVVADLQADLFDACRKGDPRRGARDQRAAQSARPRLLCASLRRHAQPDEGGAGDAGPHPGRPRPPPAHADPGRGASGHPRGALQSEPHRCQKSKSDPMTSALGRQAARRRAAAASVTTPR
jgi:4-hydroxy-tetrahydrodipicolinate synthase